MRSIRCDKLLLCTDFDQYLDSCLVIYDIVIYDDTMIMQFRTFSGTWPFPVLWICTLTIVSWLPYEWIFLRFDWLILLYSIVLWFWPILAASGSFLNIDYIFIDSDFNWNNCTTKCFAYVYCVLLSLHKSFFHLALCMPYKLISMDIDLTVLGSHIYR